MNFPEIRIEFNKTNSTNYKSAMAIFSKFEDFNSVDGLNSFTLDFESMPFDFNAIQFYLKIITKWKNTKIYIDNKLSNNFYLRKLFDIFLCYNSYKNAANQSLHCFVDGLLGIEGWGCSHFMNIHRHLPKAFSDIGYYNNIHYWYEYGNLENKVWKVHKDKILSLLKAEATEMGMIYCPIFNISKLEKYVEYLPETINPDENSDWEFVYKETDNGFMKDKVIVGVRPSGLMKYWESRDIPNKEIKEDYKNKDERYVPDVNFEDIGGLGDTLTKIREVIELPMKKPELFKTLNIQPHKGILLSGPPGCGKTLIAKAIAKEVNAHFIAVNGPEIISMWVGQSEENLRNIFSEAKKYAPSIILFDEIDSIARKRIGGVFGRHDDQLVNQLLTLLDGFETNNDVIILGTTNRPELLDEAVMRPGRFDYNLEIKKPTLEGCKEILSIYIKNMPIDKNFNLDKFTEKLLGLSGADISFIATEAAYNCMRRNIDTKNVIVNNTDINYENIIINEDDFNRALEQLIGRNEKPENYIL